MNMPARLNTTQTSSVLGFAEHDMAILVKAGLLDPLGNPAPNAPKYFAAVDIEERAKDRRWLHKATKAVSTHWKAKRKRSSKDGNAGGTASHYLQRIQPSALSSELFHGAADDSLGIRDTPLR